MSSFKYRPRANCVCGAAINPLGPEVSKATEFGEVRFVQCSACGSFMQAPQITTDTLKEWYDSDHYQGGNGRTGSAYIDYESDEAARVLEARGRFRKHLAPFLPRNARVLEIGCATGSLLSVIRDAGHSTLGIDLSPRFAEAAVRLHGLDVKPGDFMDFQLDESSFDAIILLGTASNMQDFPAALGKMHNLLKPAGFILFNFPHADSLTARLYGRGYWMFAPSVSNFMTVTGCRKLLERLCFTTTCMSFDTQQPSFGKLLHHSGLSRLFPFPQGNWTKRPLPLALPIPAITLVRASRTAAL